MTQIRLMFRGVSLKLGLKNSVGSVQEEAQRSSGCTVAAARPAVPAGTCPHEFCSHTALEHCLAHWEVHPGDH